jgi:hypothetical protein
MIKRGRIQQEGCGLNRPNHLGSVTSVFMGHLVGAARVPTVADEFDRVTRVVAVFAAVLAVFCPHAVAGGMCAFRLL